VLAETTQQLTTLKVNFEDLEKRKPALTLTKEAKMEVLQAEIDAFESTEKIFKVVLIICCLQNEF
jgi:exonuclease SbcC